MWSLLLLGCPEQPVQTRPLRSAPAKITFHTDRSGRCAECHEKLVDEWQTSAHAGSATRATYLRTASGSAECTGCHAPLTGRADALVAAEGVTCDVCHSLRKSLTDGGMELDVSDRVKYGPLCDAQDHHFHKMGCSPEHLTSALCQGCHQWVRGTLPILTEYDEWLASDAFAQDRMCQDCHMPTDEAEVAVGARARQQVGHHQLLGPTGRLRKEALSLTVNLQSTGNAYELETLLTNDGAGHSVPTGFPGRQIELTVRATGANGTTTRSQVYSRVLGKDGVEVLFTQATSVLSDNRIAAGATARERFELQADVKRVELEVSWNQFSPAVAAALGVATPAQEPLLRAALEIPPRSSRRTKPGLIKTSVAQEVASEVPH